MLTDNSLKADQIPDLDDENVLIPPESAARSGPDPQLYVVDDVEEEVATVVEQVKEWIQEHNEPQSIGVLYGNTWERRNRAYLLYNALQELPGGVFWLTSPDRKSRDRLGESNERIILATIHSAKGLEFPSVALCGIWKDSDDIDASRMLAYVGMTRAQERLTVVTIKGSPLTDNLARVKAPSPALVEVP